MNITKFDLSIIFIMSIVVITMSFAFPAMGLTGSEADESDIPRFNITTDAFNWTNEYPQDVERKELSGGTINISNKSTDNFAYKLPKDAELAGFNESGSYSSPTWEVRLGEWDGTFYYDKQNVSIGEKFFLNDTGTYEIHGEFYYDNGYKYIDYRAIQGGTDKYSGIIGGIFRIADIIFWGISFMIVTALNLLAILIQSIVYFVTMMHWLIVTYFNIIAGTPTAWGAVFVTIPGIILFAEFSKITILLVNVIWIG